MKLRSAAAQIIGDVLLGASLNDVLPKYAKPFRDSRDQAFLQALCYGVCRWYFRLDAIASALLDKPLNEKDLDVYVLILIGLYQLTEMRVPEHAAVSETVAAVKKSWAKGLVNAVLRNYLRNAEQLAQEVMDDDLAHFSHPIWMIEQIGSAWPEDWQAILQANNEHPPFSLRVNLQKNTRENYQSILTAQNIENVIIPETHAGITLQKPIDVHELPGFTKGEISVQDGAAQLAAELLDLAPAQRVLDACAAPGGKTTHILEQQSNLEKLIALDHDADRLKSIRENLQRLQLQADCIVGDAGNVSTWWDGKPFDRILLDAPCSASGVIRRHPDIKLLRRADDIPALAKEQSRILNALWPLLKTGGLLVYATCSVFPEENSQVLKSFLAKQPDAKEEIISATWGQSCEIGRQILPGMQNMDGFYFACLRKN